MTSATYGTLASYQRIMMDNPRTSLRNRMSELNISTIPPRSANASTRKRKPRTDDKERTGTGGDKSGGADSEGGGFRHDDFGEDGGEHDKEHDGRDGGAGRGDWKMANSGAVPEGDGFVYETPQEAAGHSELQTAFERAYERMLREPPPSVVDTVLSSAWQPNASKSAAWRRSFQREMHKKRDWEVRIVVSEKKPFYDSLLDNHCRRVVENPNFKKMLLRTRPDSEFLLAQRVIGEERKRSDGKKDRKLKMNKKHKAMRWTECVKMMMELGSDEAEQAVKRGAEGEGGPEGAGQEAAMNEGEIAIEKMKAAWGVAENGINASFNSLNAVLMSEPHRPAAFEALKAQLDKVWTLLKVPPADTKHVRRYLMVEPSATNLAHLFYQVSRWTQYNLQVQKTCELIYRREMLLQDLQDHLQLCGGAADEALTHKLADFYAYSHEAIYHTNAVKALYPGSIETAILLQDYIGKVRADTVQVRQAAPPASNKQPFDGDEADSVTSGQGQDAMNAQLSEDVRIHRVKLAAELVLESVQREAAVYTKILAKAPPWKG